MHEVKNTQDNYINFLSKYNKIKLEDNLNLISQYKKINFDFEFNQNIIKVE